MENFVKLNLWMLSFFVDLSMLDDCNDIRSDDKDFTVFMQE